MDHFMVTMNDKSVVSEKWLKDQAKIRDIINKMESLSLTDQRKFAQIFS